MLWVWWLVSLRVGCPGLVFWVAVVVFLAVVTVARWLEECVAVYRLVWTKDCPGVPLRDDGSELKPPSRIQVSALSCAFTTSSMYREQGGLLFGPPMVASHCRDEGVLARRNCRGQVSAAGTGARGGGPRKSPSFRIAFHTQPYPRSNPSTAPASIHGGRLHIFLNTSSSSQATPGCV